VTKVYKVYARKKQFSDPKLYAEHFKIIKLLQDSEYEF